MIANIEIGTPNRFDRGDWVAFLQLNIGPLKLHNDLVISPSGK
jgi:hypothetical protein